MKQTRFKTDHDFMEAALQEAVRAAGEGEVPVGAVGVIDDKIIARGHNRRENKCDPLGHAEIEIIRKVSRQLKSWRLTDLTIYVTLEPCLMCLGTMSQARIRGLVFGANDPVAGAFSKYMILQDYIIFTVQGGLLAKQALSLLKSFFRQRRKQGKIVEGASR